MCDYQISNKDTNHSKPSLNPPRLAERLLRLFVPQEDSETILGDFAEEYYNIAFNFGKKRAWGWYWLEVVKSIPSLIPLTKRKLKRSDIMQRLSFFEQNSKVAVAGLILSIPALILVFGGVLQSGFGLSQFSEAVNHDILVFHPIILMGGLALAFGLNLFSVARIKFEEGNLVGTLKIRGKLLNLGFVLFCCLLAAIIFVYLLFENGPCIFGQQVAC